MPTSPHARSRSAAQVACGLGLLLAALLPAQAARPFVTEDAGVLPRGGCEVEPVLARSRAKGQAKTRIRTLQGACGVGRGSQLSAGYGRASADGDSESTLALGGKTNFVDGGDKGPSFTLAYGANYVKPAGGARQFDSAAINLVATQALGPKLQLHANLGWTRSRSANQQSTTWGAALEYKATEAVDVGVEAFADDRSKPWLGTGLRWTLNDSLSFNASAAGQTGGDKARLVTLGARFAF